MHLAFTDLTIPLAGIPITITRSYDTLNANTQGDFGQGWTLDEGDFQVQVSQPDGTLQSLGTLTPFVLGTRVVITRPGQAPEGFTFEAQPVTTGYFGFEQFVNPIFVPDAGVTDTLSVPPTELLANGDGTYSGEDADATPYNPADPLFGDSYTLTTHSGIAYTLYADTGQLSTVTDRNGNTLTYQPTGITSNTGVAVTFTRDPVTNDITAITDPRGNAITYGYDMYGNLISATDRADQQTQFFYSTTQPHYLDHVIDPNGITVAQAAYTGGRVTGLTDATGATTSLSYNLTNLSETVTPPQLGGNPSPSSTLSFDSQGNVSSTTDALGNSSSAGYDTSNNLTSQTMTVSGQPLTTSYTYDSFGDVQTATDPAGDTTSFAYNATGQPITSTDALGNTTYYGYDANGNLTSTTSPMGLTTSFSYDASGNVLSTTTPDGITSSTYYQKGDTGGAPGDLKSTTDTHGTTTTYTYDANNNPLTSDWTWTQPGSNPPVTQDMKTTNVYDANDHLIQTIAADGTITDTVYDASGRAVWTDDPHTSGQTSVDGTETIYDADGRVVTTEQFHDVVIDFSDLNTSHPSSYFSAAGTPFSITSTTYDAQGRTAWSDDPHMPGQPTDGTETFYDADGRVIATEQFHNVNISYTIGSGGIAGSPSVTSDSSPYLVTDTIYDTAGRVVWTDDGHAPGTTPNGTNTVYDNAGRVTSTGRYSNVLITLTIDPSTGVASNSLNSTPTPISSTSSTYNAAGQLLTSTDALGNTTQYVYDADGRMIKTIYADGTFTTSTYDGNGRKVAAMDQAGQITNYTYDQYGNLASVSLPDPNTAGGTNQPTYVYAYDDYGNLTSETDPLNNTTTYAYDAYGRKVSEALPMLPDGTTPTETWSYNALGQLASTTDFDGHVINYTYDDQGRVTEKDEFTSSTATTAAKVVTYTYDNYDSQNRRYDTVTINDTASLNDNGATTTYYDTEGDIVEIDSLQGTITYTYNDSTGQKTGETTNNTDIQYAYDQEGRLATVTVDKLDGASITPLVTTYSYDLNNNLITTNFANGTVETRTYDSLGRLLTVTTTNGSATIVDYTYTLDADGRRVQVVEASGRTVNYTYDYDGRLTQEKITNDPAGNNWTYTYTYDLAGNRLSLNDNGPNFDSLSYTYDADGRLTDVSGTTGVNGDSTDTTYTYDANGSMLTSTTTVNGTQTSQTTYTWDLEGHMIAAVTTGTGAGTASYTYDDSGNRTSQTVNNQTTTYLNDPNQAYDQVLEEYAPGGILLATYVRGLDLLFQDRTAAGGNTGLSFYAVDGLGSTRALTNSSGAVTDTYTYEAYGALHRLDGEHAE